MVYHGYENGYRTLGRQCLLEPIEWTADGWFKPKGGDLSSPLPMPNKGIAGPAGFAKSGALTKEKFGVQWCFFNPGPDEMKRVRFEKGSASITGKGTSPADSSPLSCIVGDRSYEATVTLEISGAGHGGLLLHYNEHMFVGVGFSTTHMLTYHYAREQSWMREAVKASTVRIRVRNDQHIVTFFYALDDGKWIQHPWQMETSGMHHNVFGGFLSLQPAVYSAGEGAVHMLDFQYRALA
jgi:xylan 1,4-beta-xylosidase